MDIRTGQVEKFGWKVPEWCAATGVSRSSVYELLAEKRLDSVKLGHSRLITTHPSVFLSSLKSVA